MSTDQFFTLGGRPTVRVERHYPHPIDRVWRAVTTPEHLEEWFPSPVELDLRVGGAMRFAAFEGDPGAVGTIEVVDEPRRLAFSWGSDRLTLELMPDGDGTTLALTHTFDDRYGAPSFATGWEICLASLSSVLAGEPVPRPDRGIARHEELVHEFGLDVPEVTDSDGGWTVRFERQLTCPASVAWDLWFGKDRDTGEQRVAPAVGEPLTPYMAPDVVIGTMTEVELHRGARVRRRADRRSRRARSRRAHRWHRTRCADHADGEWSRSRRAGRCGRDVGHGCDRPSRLDGGRVGARPARSGLTPIRVIDGCWKSLPLGRSYRLRSLIAESGRSDMLNTALPRRLMVAGVAGLATLVAVPISSSAAAARDLFFEETASAFWAAPHECADGSIVEGTLLVQSTRDFESPDTEDADPTARVQFLAVCPDGTSFSWGAIVPATITSTRNLKHVTAVGTGIARDNLGGTHQVTFDVTWTGVGPLETTVNAAWKQARRARSDGDGSGDVR